MATSLPVTVSTCAEKLLSVISLIPTDDASRKALWLDEAGRFKLWVANIGAHQSGQSSLEYRLRDASHIRGEILTLLQDLAETLSATYECFQHFPAQDQAISSRQQDGSEMDEQNHDSRIISAILESFETEGRQSPFELKDQLHKDVIDIITGLMRISMLIRHPSRRDHIIERRSAEVTHFSPYDINHVRDKFPKANEEIVNRLGSAITNRRAQLQYWERHHAKLSQGIASLDQDNESKAPPLSDTVATEFGAVKGRALETRSNSGFSSTSYALSLLGSGPIKVPQRPPGSEDEAPFECPYCYFIITVDSDRTWAKHVMTDLQPYVCVFSRCISSKKHFTSRHEWYEHVSRFHLREQESGADASEVLDAPLVKDRQYGTSSVHCPLCTEDLFSEQVFERHVAKHLEELALFCLPSVEKDEEIEQYDGLTSPYELPIDLDDQLRDGESTSPSETEGVVMEIDPRLNQTPRADKLRRESPTAPDKRKRDVRSRHGEPLSYTDPRTDRFPQGKAPSQNFMEAVQPSRVLPERGREFWIPANEIKREVLQHEISRYFGQDATVRPGNVDGLPGYFIKAYRDLTTEMLRSLKEDSARFEAAQQQKQREGRRSVAYVNSDVMTMRNHQQPREQEEYRLRDPRNIEDEEMREAPPGGHPHRYGPEIAQYSYRSPLLGLSPSGPRQYNEIDTPQYVRDPPTGQLVLVPKPPREPANSGRSRR